MYFISLVKKSTGQKSCPFSHRGNDARIVPGGIGKMCSQMGRTERKWYFFGAVLQKMSTYIHFSKNYKEYLLSIMINPRNTEILVKKLQLYNFFQ